MDKNRLIGASREVLDKGFVRIVDIMGDDSSIVQAARVSYGAGTKTVREDSGLINFLMQHRHTTPFEMCVIKFHIKVPLFVWAQWKRHRTASFNEISLRYSEAKEEFMRTPSYDWRRQSGRNRQGSEGNLTNGEGLYLTEEEGKFLQYAWNLYQARLRAGVAREQARKDLPQSLYTEVYWKIDLHNLLHFLELRMAPDAQKEIRLYAHAISQVIAEWVPMTWGAFMVYRVSRDA